jgi:Secretion system C-terminal sorting domain
MKKICLMIAAVGLSSVAFAQQNFKITKPVKATAPKQQLFNSVGNTNGVAAIENFILDYTALDGFSILGYCVNSAFNAGDTAYYNPTQLATVSIVNPLVGYTDPNDIIASYVEYPYFNFGLTLDSITFLGAHENNTGLYNKFVINIVGTNAQGVPNTTVLTSIVDSTNTTLSPSGNWSGGSGELSNVFVKTLYLGYDIPANQRAAINLTYIADKLDTFCIIASCIDDNEDQIADGPATYANSFVKIPFIGGGAQISTTNLISGVNEDPFAGQNIWLFANVTYNNTTVSENQFIKGVKIGQSYPNPANKITSFSYELQKPTNVTFEVYDMNGRLVKEYNEGVKETGKHVHTINVDQFTSGVYFYTIKTNETSITKRMVITK